MRSMFMNLDIRGRRRLIATHITAESDSLMDTVFMHLEILLGPSLKLAAKLLTLEGLILLMDHLYVQSNIGCIVCAVIASVAFEFLQFLLRIIFGFFIIATSDDGITSIITFTLPVFIYFKSSILGNRFWSYFTVRSCLVSSIENFGESRQATAFTEEGFAICKIFAIFLEHTMVCSHVSME